MPLTANNNKELSKLGREVRSRLREDIDFLEAKHTKRIAARLRHSEAASRLRPVESFELEMKHKLSEAAHELMHALDRIDDSEKGKEPRLLLRYARANLEDAGKELDAAQSAYNALLKYARRLSASSVVLEHEIRPVLDKLFAKLEELRAFQRELQSKVVLRLSEAVAR